MSEFSKKIKLMGLKRLGRVVLQEGTTESPVVRKRSSFQVEDAVTSSTKKGLPSGKSVLAMRSLRSRLYRWQRRSAASWLRRLPIRSYRFKTTFKSLYRRRIWEEYQQFQVGIEAAKRGFLGNDVFAIRNEYRRELRAARNAASKAGNHSILKPDLGLGLQELKVPHGFLFEEETASLGIKRYNRYKKLKLQWLLRKGLDARCYITQTRNNVFVVLMCDKSCKVLMELSAGKLGYKGAGKRTRLVAVQLGKRIGEESISKNYRKITLYLRGRISMLVRGVVQGLRLADVGIRRLVYVREIAHNGVRMRKVRRM